MLLLLFLLLHTDICFCISINLLSQYGHLFNLFIFTELLMRILLYLLYYVFANKLLPIYIIIIYIYYIY